jgi:hypothetical protein
VSHRRTAPIEFGRTEDPIERLAHVRLVEPAADEIALDLNEPASPVEVAPLQRQEFAWGALHWTAQCT